MPIKTGRIHFAVEAKLNITHEEVKTCKIILSTRLEIRREGKVREISVEIAVQ